MLRISHWAFHSPATIVLLTIFIMALVAAVTRMLLPLLGVNLPFGRVSAPWRFSLLSISVLVAASAVVLALFRESLDASLLGLLMLFVAWSTAVRFIALRQSVSDRSQRSLAATIHERPPQASLATTDRLDRGSEAEDEGRGGGGRGRT